MRLAHSMADTLVTPINDSFLDFDVLGTVDPATYSVTGESHYAEMVRGYAAQAPPGRRRQHRLDRRSQSIVDDRIGATSSWSPMGSTNCRCGWVSRAIDGFAERVVYREFFPRGLTALDDLDEATLGTRRTWAM